MRDIEEIKQEQTMIGIIVDMPLEDFKKELVKQKINIGTMNNLILSLTGTYHELRNGKEALIKLVLEGRREHFEIEPVLNGIYSKMLKIEEKLLYLKERVKELVDVDKTPN